jgi:hypothetical protein
MHGTGSDKIEVTHGRLSDLLNHKQYMMRNSHCSSRHTWHQALTEISWHPCAHYKQRHEKECDHPENKCIAQEVTDISRTCQNTNNKWMRLATHIVLLVILGTKLYQILHSIHMSIMSSVIERSVAKLKTNAWNRK